MLAAVWIVGEQVTVHFLRVSTEITRARVLEHRRVHDPKEADNPQDSPRAARHRGGPTAANRREAEILARGGRKPKQEKAPPPTLARFWPRFMEEYAKANRQKASYTAERESIYRSHFREHLAELRLDQITDEEVQRLKAKLHDRSPKTVNNVLVALNTVLKVAIEWGVLERLPCRIRLLKVPRKPAAFYEPEVYERVVRAAESAGATARLAVLLGGDAGLRLGEILTLQWNDIDFTRGLIRPEKRLAGRGERAEEQQGARRLDDRAARDGAARASKCREGKGGLLFRRQSARP